MEESIRIFLVDSSRDYLELLQAVLTQEKDMVIVGTATSGDRAAEAIPGSGADLLVTDLLLPGLDGLSLLRRLRAEGCLPHTIVVSAFFNDRVARTVSRLADNFLPKPCPAAELVVHIRESVRGSGRAFVRDYENVVSRALLSCGVQPHMDGYDYLRDCLICTLDDRSLLRGVTKSLYRDVAKRFDTTPACVERSIRSAIEKAWEKLTPVERSRRFGHLFDAFPEAPSNVPFLTIMTEYIESRYEKNDRSRR